MLFKIPKNTENLKWTNHVIDKMRFYGLSPQKVKNVIERPKRKEIGIAESTVAVMQPSGSRKNPSEIWAMYAGESQSVKCKTQNSRNKKIIIISAWRYPGISPVREAIPIPPEIEEEIYDILKELK